MSNATLPQATRSRPSVVDGVAWGFIAFSVVTLALLILPLLPGEVFLASLSVEAGSGGLTDGVIWLFERSNTVTLLLMIGASITLGLSIALLRRHPWARQAFISLMGLGFVGVLGGAAITPLTFGLMADSAVDLAGNEDPVAGLTTALAILIMLSTALLVLFAWTSWKLVTPAVRSEFERTPVAKDA